MITVIARAVVSALSDLLVAALSNLWRTAAVLSVLLSGWLWVALGRAESDVSALGGELERAGEQLQAARGSAIGWESEARSAEARLAALVKKYEIDVQAQRDAAQAARQREADADAALKAWTARYANALRDPECADVLRMRICESLQ